MYCVNKIHFRVLIEHEQNCFAMIHRLKLAAFILLAFLPVLPIWAQGSRTGKTNVWSEIDTLIEKQYYKKAYERTQVLYDAALKRGDSRQSLVGARYLSVIGSEFMESSSDSILARYKMLLPRLNPVDAAICRIFLAEFYYARSSSDYYDTKMESADEDYHFWSQSRFKSVVASLIREALSDVKLLQSIPSDSIAELTKLTEGTAGDVTPTAYDVLLDAAMECFFFNKIPSKNIVNRDLLYADAARFLRAEVKADSSSSMAAFMLDCLKKREAYHLAHRSSDDMMIYMYVNRCYNLENLVKKRRSSNQEIEDLKSIIAHFRKRNDKSITDLYYMLAEVYDRIEQYQEALDVIDTALSLHPDSPGGVNCFNSRQQILKKCIDGKMTEISHSSRNQLAIFEVRNVDTLYFRIVDGSKEDNDVNLLKEKPIKEWYQPLDLPRDYKQHSVLVTIPQVPQGEYYLLASSTRDFSKDCESILYEASDVMFLLKSSNTSLIEGFLVDRCTGKPVEGQAVELTCFTYNKGKSKKQFLGSSVTDADGYFSFSDFKETYDMYLSVKYKGFETSQSVRQGYSRNRRGSQKSKMFFDRPVYRPGDTVAFSFFMFDKNGNDASVVGNERLSFKFMDVNYKTIDSLTLVTDEFGTCNGRFVLSSEAMPGTWNITVSNKNGMLMREYINVEAYKQPKFTVTLRQPEGMYRFGDTIRIEGIAASYNSVPISNAKVEYSVERVHQRYFGENADSYKVVNGELTTNIDGSFTLSFVPEKVSKAFSDIADDDEDEMILLKVISEYGFSSLENFRVNVSVTDINGETHESVLNIPVGDESSFLKIAKTALSRDSIYVSVGRYNLVDKPLAGDISVSVFRMKTPESPLLCHELMPYQDWIEKTMSKSEFQKMFPHIDYDNTVFDYKKWDIDKEVFNKNVTVSPDKPFRYDFSGMEAGVYKVVAKQKSAKGDTVSVSEFVLFQPSTAKRPVVSSLISVDYETSVVEVGDTVNIRVGSRFNDVTLYVVIRCDSTCTHRLYKINNEYINISVPVVDYMRGGLKLSFAAVKENIFRTDWVNIDVPFSDKRLDVSFHSFRDKLQPGDNERWTLTIKDKKSGKGLPANLVMTMYDNALDSYRSSGRWSLSDIWTGYYLSSSFGNCYISTSRSHTILSRITLHKSSIPMYYRERTLVNGSFTYQEVYYKMRNSVRNSKKLMDSYELESDSYTDHAESNKVPVIEIGAPESGARLSSDDIVAMEEAVSADRVVAAVAGVGYDSGFEEEEPVQVRSNLNTLAFFKPNLRSDSDGNVELSFTVPGLLTKWNVKGLAWTKDIKVGELSASVLTHKRLMVVPNVPRFLRQGDTCIFSVKVSNMSGKKQNINVELTMTDAATDKPVPMVMGGSRQQLTLNDGTSGEVSFKLAVPEGQVFVSNYKVVATAAGCSDGEQGPIPLLPNRQMVTESMSFYINGKGRKDYSLDHLTTLDMSAPDLTLVNHALTLDVTPNPIWLAIQSLPYLSQKKDPSVIYLVNSIYANSLSESIVASNPEIERTFKEWEQYEPDAFSSALDRNASLSQVASDEAPWLRDAAKEEQRHRDIANFFNRSKLNQQITSDIQKLIDAQRNDGSWSWIPGGTYPCLYTTHYVLRIMGQQGFKQDHTTRSAMKRAFEYVNKEAYDYYVKFAKKSQIDIVNLDYLYLVSLYPDLSLSKKYKEAYDYFYDNAKKHNKEYTSLYSQAMLGLVFQRNGDAGLAREMVTRLLEKSLYSDEAGLYWRDNYSGYFWYQRPIETQSMLIRAVSEILGDKETVAKMQQWLLKQKQTTCWSTDVSTVNAIQALLVGAENTTGKQPLQPSSMSVSFGSHSVATDTSRLQLHLSQRVEANDIRPSDGRLTVKKDDSGIAWGALYWQYFEQIDKIPASSMGITLESSLFALGKDNTLTAVSSGGSLRVGDRVRLRVKIIADRNMEYLQLKLPRCAAFEPVNTASGWRWGGGLRYYLAVTNTAATLYIDRIDKGSYVAEFDFYVNNSGSFTTPPLTIQCLYAPEFRALCPQPKLSIGK